MKIDKDMNYYFQLEAIDGYFEYYRRPRLVGFFAIEKAVHRRSTVSNICNSCSKKENYLYSFSRFLKYKRILSRFCFSKFSCSCIKFLTLFLTMLLLNTRRVC